MVYQLSVLLLWCIFSRGIRQLQTPLQLGFLFSPLFPVKLEDQAKAE